MAAGVNYNLASTALAKQTITPQAITSTTNGTACDFQLADGPIDAILSIGVVSGTNPTMDVKLQESDTSGGTYSDISGATFTQQTAAGISVISTNLRTKRWVRAVGTIGGTSTPTFNMDVTLIGRLKIVGSGAGVQS